MGKPASPSSACNTAISPGSGGHAATDCSDDEPVSMVAADVEADMMRVQQLVDDICSDLTRGSPQHEAKTPSGEPNDVRHSDTAAACAACPCSA